MDQFYRDNYRIVYGYLLSLCGNPVLAEDLAAETFLKAIQQLDSYDSQYKASTCCAPLAGICISTITNVQNGCYPCRRQRPAPSPLRRICICKRSRPRQPSPQPGNCQSFSAKSFLCVWKECPSGRSGMPWAKTRIGPGSPISVPKASFLQKWRAI